MPMSLCPISYGIYSWYPGSKSEPFEGNHWTGRTCSALSTWSSFAWKSGSTNPGNNTIKLFAHNQLQRKLQLDFYGS